MNEELGDMRLPDDAAAMAFATLVVADVLRDNARDYAGWTLDVTADGESIGVVRYV